MTFRNLAHGDQAARPNISRTSSAFILGAGLKPRHVVHRQPQQLEGLVLPPQSQPQYRARRRSAQFIVMKAQSPSENDGVDMSKLDGALREKMAEIDPTDPPTDGQGLDGGKGDGNVADQRGDESKGESEGPPSPGKLIGELLNEPAYEDVRVFLGAFVGAMLFRAFVVEPRYIPSGSMLPTFEIGDQLLLEKVTKRVLPFDRGDVVIFKAPPALIERGYSEGDVFIKRIVGVPGDKVEIHDGRVIVNGEVKDESYIAEKPKYEWGPQMVPPGSVLVLGDNRNNSYDSHIWGFLSQEKVIGKAFCRYWPISRFGGIPR